VLVATLTRLYERSLRVWFVSRGAVDVTPIQGEHERLADALRRRNGAAAADIMRQHIMTSRAAHTPWPG
jgi:DNA-binding FadR family transcriptional regulator